MDDTTRWQYKTILLSSISIDSWIIADKSRQSMTLKAIAEGEKSQGIGELLGKYSDYLNTTLESLGAEGWELVSIWQMDPSQFLKFQTRWMTFKRQIR